MTFLDSQSESSFFRTFYTLNSFLSMPIVCIRGTNGGDVHENFRVSDGDGY